MCLISHGKFLTTGPGGKEVLKKRLKKEKKHTSKPRGPAPSKRIHYWPSSITAKSTVSGHSTFSRNYINITALVLIDLV